MNMFSLTPYLYLTMGAWIMGIAETAGSLSLNVGGGRCINHGASPNLPLEALDVS